MLSLSYVKIANFLYTARQKTVSSLLNLFSYLHFKLYFLAVLLLNIAAWYQAYMINAKVKADEIISLHFNVDFGVNLIGTPGKAYIMPATGLIILLSNLIVNMNFYKKDRVISHILLAAAVLANAALVISLQLVYYINFR